MKNRIIYLLIIVGLLLSYFQSPGLAEENRHSSSLKETQDLNNLRELAPRVFIDCRGCDRDYFREHITYINYVRDRQDADIHVLITDQPTGSGGREYTFTFIGQKKFEGKQYTLVYNSRPTATRDDIRRGQVEVLQRGLFPFLIETPLSDYIYINFKERLGPTSVNDPWKFWIFSLSLEGNFQGEESRKTRSLEVNFSANKVTPEIKIRLGFSGEFDRRKYIYEEETIKTASDEKNFTGMVVKSLTGHWSAGAWVEAESSTYKNMDLYFTVAPAVEFNIFPYSESTRRQLRLLYRIGLIQNDYNEKTIFGKLKETLYNESLTTTLEIREPWGSMSASLEGSHYFHDFSKNRLQLRGFLSFRVFRGLSVDIRGRYERIHDQLSLPVGEASLDEVLLKIKELQTAYDYYFSIGFRYTFGSVYSNVVNPRFGGIRYRGWR
ncbi:MAG: hypothetical protein B5M54_02725 [Candidatus Aminicenantes bacterium 4484_214]|nr:MAG: hypothetical protein B5M54_02725 [Candidatus Aminicenantes bacterium 4484_214]